MKYFLDCEFIEHPGTLDLISIGIVPEDNFEDNSEYYAINAECDFSKASDWVLENVLNPIGLDRRGFNVDFSDPSVNPNIKDSYSFAKPLSEIKTGILEFIDIFHPSPEFWGEWCAYDWVAFCWIFGAMMDLPAHFPMRCRDIIQLCEDQLQIPSSQLPPSLETKGNHHALLGAKTVKMRYEWLINQQRC